MTGQTKDRTPRELLGNRSRIRVLEEPARVLVRWWKDGRRRYATYAKTPHGRLEAKAFALGLAARLAAPAAPVRLTTAELWSRYLEANASTLRSRTVALYTQRWRRWALWVDPASIAEDVPTVSVARFRGELTKLGAAVNQIRGVVRVVKLVYAWADELELIAKNRVGRYRFKVGKEEKVHAPPPYTEAEWLALLVALHGGQRELTWRPWVFVAIAGSLGPRSRALLHLRWSEIDLAAGTVTWLKQWDKVGKKDRVQPLTDEAYAALRTAQGWRTELGYTGPWVLFSTHKGQHRAQREADGVYRYSSLAAAVSGAEQHARPRIAHEPFRLNHGLRRLAANRVRQATGDPWLALQWIGDDDPRRAKEYLQSSLDSLQRVVTALAGREIPA